MKTETRRWWISVALAGGLLVAAAAFGADEKATVKRLGKTIAEFKDDAIQVAVSWKYPQLHPDEAWTFFETWVMPISGRPVEIAREDISVFLPDGTRLNLPSQKKLGEGLPDIQRVLAVGNVSRDPMEGYFGTRHRILRLGFHEVPGTYLTYDLRILRFSEAARGDLFFQNPKGKWEKGIYTLSIQNKEMNVKIPMPIGIEGELERIK